MTTAYHDRFAAALRAELPRGFEIWADQYLVTARYESATLVGDVPAPGDKRGAVTLRDVRDWVIRTASSLRGARKHFTPEAHQAASLLLDSLDLAGWDVR